jgi:hypothetical protein
MLYSFLFFLFYLFIYFFNFFFKKEYSLFPLENQTGMRKIQKYLFGFPSWLSFIGTLGKWKQELVTIDRKAFLSFI